MGRLLLLTVNTNLNVLLLAMSYIAFSLTALPETPDHVVIGVASRFVEEVFDQALRLGVKAATIYAS